MANTEDFLLQSNATDLRLCAFALTDCIIQIEAHSAKYLRAVHRTALELAVPNLYGSEIGGFWLKSDQIKQLRKLPDCYPSNEIEFVRLAVEAYLLAQTQGSQAATKTLSSSENFYFAKSFAIDPS